MKKEGSQFYIRSELANLGFSFKETKQIIHLARQYKSDRKYTINEHAIVARRLMWVKYTYRRELSATSE